MRIIKEGDREYEMICSSCGTVFRFELQEIKRRIILGDYIRCPKCNYKNETDCDGWTLYKIVEKGELPHE